MIRSFSRRTQRTVVTAALTALALVIALLPLGRPDKANAANAAGVQCGPNDAYRAHLTLHDGTAINPCISRVPLSVKIGSFTLKDLNYAGGSSTQNVMMSDGQIVPLYHIYFTSFHISSNGVLGAKPAQVSGAPIPWTAAPYTLNVLPDGQANIGGSGVVTDLWLTGDSVVSISTLICTTWTIADAAGINGILQFLLFFTGGYLSSCGSGANLKVYYMVSYKPSGSSGTGMPMSLPDTNLKMS